MGLQAGAFSTYDSLDDVSLVNLARLGHSEAFRVITERCNQRLFRVARAVVQNEVEAEDIVQDAYLRAFAGLDSFRGEASIRTWLTRITLNEALGRLRSRRPTVGVERIDDRQDGRVMPLAAGLECECPEARAARLQVRHLIEQAIDGLPQAFRVVFVMRVVEDCSIRETAESLGIPPETVKTRLHRARRLLRIVLDDKLGDIAKEAFPFLGEQCRRITARVLDLVRTGTESLVPESV
jgi:RNA polymerase sigma-70 factor, ECF subfamily